MTVGSTSLTVKSSGLGQGQGRKLVAIVGCSESGTPATATTKANNQDLLDAHGFGPVSEQAALYLELAGGPVLTCKAASATAAALGGFCQGGGGSSAAGTLSADGGNTATAIPALTGTPDKPYAVRIRVATAGANIAANPVVQISLDGGVSYLAVDAVDVSATAQSIGSTGLSLAWTDGSFVLNNSWSAVGASCPSNADATGSSTPAFSGTPNDAHDIVLQVVTASASLAALTGSVKISLDGGLTFGDPVLIPTTGVIAIPNTGVTCTFGAGTLVVGDFYRVRSSPPLWSTAGLETALAGLVTAINAGNDVDMVHIVGPIDATSQAVIESWGDTQKAAGNDLLILCEVRDQAEGESVSTWKTAVKGVSPGLQGLSSDIMDVGVCAAEVKSALRPGLYWRRNGQALRGPRLAAIPLRQHPGRVKTGPVQGLRTDGLAGPVHHDLTSHTDLDAARFSGVQSLVGRRGEFFFTSRSFALSTSDFNEVQRIRVMNAAASAARTALADYVGDDVELKTDGTGRIAEAEAKGIEAEIRAKVAAAVMNEPNNHVTAITVTVDRTNNIGTSRTLRVAIAIVPRGSILTVSTTISYTLGG
jgi:hypothetical protein